MTNLIIIAAGLGTRLGSPYPKALVPLTSKDGKVTSCAHRAVELLSPLFDKIFIVTNVEHQEHWKTFEPFEHTGNVFNMDIVSGMGDGHAVFSGLSYIAESKHSIDDIVICWGDVYFENADIVKELLEQPLHIGTMPVRFEQNPYVTIKTQDDVVTHAEFSKHGETNMEGYHDMSLFRFNGITLLPALTSIVACGYRFGRKTDISTLTALSYFWNISEPVNYYETKYSTISFNTMAELEKVKELHAQG